MPNFKYGVQLPDQDHLSFNAVVFATAEEAEAGALQNKLEYISEMVGSPVENTGFTNYKDVALIFTFLIFGFFFYLMYSFVFDPFDSDNLIFLVSCISIFVISAIFTFKSRK